MSLFLLFVFLSLCLPCLYVYLLVCLSKHFFLFQIEFPAVTICSSGRIDKNLETGFYNSFLMFLNENNVSIANSAIDVAKKLNQVLNYRGEGMGTSCTPYKDF